MRLSWVLWPLAVAMIALRLLGSIDLRDEHGEPIDAVLRRPKLLALLAYLAIARPRGFHRRDKLIAMFWPESSQERARHALRQAIYALRRELGEESLLSRGDEELSLNEDVVLNDVAELRQALEGRREADAVESYRGDLLDGFHLGDAPAFERWLDEERGRVQGRVVQALRGLVERAEGTGSAKAVTHWGQRLTELVPHDEDAVRRVMTLLEGFGDRAGAVKVYERLARRLHDDLGLTPSKETENLATDLRKASTTANAGVTVSEERGRAKPAIPPMDIRLKRLRTRLALSSIVLAAVALVVVLSLRTSAGAPLDRNVLAVAPFDVMDARLEIWREGMADLVSARLDGAGSIRTVSPSVVYRHWGGRADPDAAQQLGVGVGSGLVLQGRIVAHGEDSVRAEGTLVDVFTGTPIGYFETRSAASRMLDLADTLAVRVLRELSGTRRFGAVRLSSLGSTSPVAIKAFLQGEQHYRRLALDSARKYYERALELDGTFALAHSRVGTVTWWRTGGTGGAFLRAGALNRGLARRESLLIAADSLYAADEVEFLPDSATWERYHRLFATLHRADLLYPNDPQIQYRLGEAHLHHGWAVGSTEDQAVTAFARAVALDSTFAPPYAHLVMLHFSLDEPEAARRTLSAYLALRPSGPELQAALVAHRLIDIPRADTPRAMQLLDTLSPRILYNAVQYVWTSADSTESAPRVAHALYRTDPRRWRGPTAALWSWGTVPVLAYRGHLKEAYALLLQGDLPWGELFFSELAKLGAVPVETAAARFADWLDGPNARGIQRALPWWAAVGDTLSIMRAIELMRARAASDTGDARVWSAFRLRLGEPYLPLARGDTATALRLFERLPEFRCSYCYWELLTMARLLAATGRNADAARVLDQLAVSSGAPLPGAPLWILERARVNDRLGNTERAVKDYSRFIGLWRNADPELQPLVEEAKEAVVRLQRER